MDKFNILSYEKELTFDREIVYEGITFKPVTVEMYNEFYTFINCLLLDKNSIPDINVLQMSYLDYLFYLSETGEEQYILNMLASLISICTDIKIDEIKYYRNEKKQIVLVLNEILIDKEKFLVMREIICNQNDVDLTIFDLDPRVREELRKTMELKNKGSNFQMGTLEEQMICIIISTYFTMEDLEKMSLRKFKKILNRIDNKMHYEIYTLGTLRGDVTLKEEFPHWLSTLEKGRFDKLITSYEETEKKVKMSNIGI